MLFPSKLILSSVAISVSLSGKTEKLLLARLMLVKCSISPTESGSLVRTLPCRSSSARYFKTRVSREVDCLFFCHSMKTFCYHLWGEQHVRSKVYNNTVYGSNSCVVLSTTSQLSEGWKELAGNGLHLIVSQCDSADFFWDTPEDLEHTIWERNELAFWQVCKEKKIVVWDCNTLTCRGMLNLFR